MPPLATQQPPLALHVPDLIMEILSWLPVKALMQLKCVCKSWRSVISDPNFAKLHLLRTKKNTNLMLTMQPSWMLDQEVHTYFFSVSSFIENPSSAINAPVCSYLLKKRHYVLGSCNGLICLGRFLNDIENQFSEYWFRLWNPALSLRSKKSPSIHVKMHGDLADNTEFGFGYDELTDTYKVVALLCDRSATEDSQRTKVKVFSFGTSCWRDIQNFPGYPCVGINSGKFIDGAINWLAIRNMTDPYKWENVTLDQLVIVSLDIRSETYKQFRMPNGIDEVPSYSPTLEVYRGCLYLFHDYEDTHFVVWKMKEFGDENSWTQFIRVSYYNLRVRVDLVEILTPFFEIVPLCISDNGEILMLGIEDNSEGVMYDRRDGSVVFTRISNLRSYMVAKDYVQSLILPC